MAKHSIAVLKNEALDGPEDQKIANFWGDGFIVKFTASIYPA